MPRQANIPRPILQSVAAQVGQLVDGLAPRISTSAAGAESLAPLQPLREATRLELAESFEVWMLPLDTPLERRTPVRDAAVSIRRWHHQIRADGSTTAYARSSRAGQLADGEVMETFVSDIASDIDAAVERLDGLRREDPAEVRLLVVPGCYLHVLWLVGEGDDPDRFLVATPARTGTTNEESLLDDAALLSLVCNRIRRPE